MSVLNTRIFGCGAAGGAVTLAFEDARNELHRRCWFYAADLMKLTSKLDGFSGN